MAGACCGRYLRSPRAAVQVVSTQGRQLQVAAILNCDQRRRGAAPWDPRWRWCPSRGRDPCRWQTRGCRPGTGGAGCTAAAQCGPSRCGARRGRRITKDHGRAVRLHGPHRAATTHASPACGRDLDVGLTAFHRPRARGVFTWYNSTVALRRRAGSSLRFVFLVGAALSAGSKPKRCTGRRARAAVPAAGGHSTWPGPAGSRQRTRPGSCRWPGVSPTCRPPPPCAERSCFRHSRATPRPAVGGQRASSPPPPLHCSAGTPAAAASYHVRVGGERRWQRAAWRASSARFQVATAWAYAPGGSSP